jgi:hypothetical protein
MKRIVKTGRDTYHASCTNCDCQFTYERDDVAIDYGTGTHRVSCPYCGHAMTHLGSSGIKRPMRGKLHPSACVAIAICLLAVSPARAQSLPLPVLELGASWTCQPPIALSAYQYNLKTGEFQQGVALMTGYGCTYRGWSVPLGVAAYGGLAVNSNAPNAAQGSVMFSVADTFAFGVGAQVFRSPADQSMISQGLLMAALNYNVGGSIAGVRNFGLRARSAGMVEGARAVRP